MAEVVGANLKLKAVGRGGERHVHDAGIVDQDVDRPALGRGFSKAAHGGEIRQVEVLDVNGATNTGGGLAALVLVTNREGDVRTRAGELAGRDKTETAVGPGDHEALPGNPGDALGVPALGCPLRHGLRPAGFRCGSA